MALGSFLNEALKAGGRHPRCSCCRKHQPEPEATLSKCVQCGDWVCFTCFDKHRHLHPATTPIRFGFCPGCCKIVELQRDPDGVLRCPEDGFGWAPHTLMRQDVPGEAICCYCGANQTFTRIPFHCARCARRLE